MTLTPLLDSYDTRAARSRRLRVARRRRTRGRPRGVSELRAAGKQIAFVTNDARRSPEEYVRKLWSLGVQASLEEVVTAGGAIQYVLAERGAGNGTYVIGSPAVFRHVAEAGHRIVNGTPIGPARPMSSWSPVTTSSLRRAADATQAVLPAPR